MYHGALIYVLGSSYVNQHVFISFVYTRGEILTRFHLKSGVNTFSSTDVSTSREECNFHLRLGHTITVLPLIFSLLMH